MILIRRYIVDSLAILGAFWLFIEIFDYFFSGYSKYVQNQTTFVIAIAAVLIISLIKNFPRKTFVTKISGVDSKISIRKGDILKCKNDIVFSSSNYFNTDLDIISERSLLGQFLIKNSVESVDIQITQSLQQTRKTKTTPKTGNTISYPIGSVANFNTSDRNVFLLAITKIVDDGKIVKPYSEHSFVEKSFDNLWLKSRDCLDNRVLSMPLIGTGIGKSYQQTLESLVFICLSYIKESKKRKINNGIEIYVKNDTFSLTEFEHIKLIIKNIAN
ncbi:macro domain-containing protein [Algoriphagus vanfongensis]|uniref:macro domain-containing protein n=1 Tax=Algoriphagus vanfongensis TaxID=426371 RepID=UPI00040648BD|nr:macro domain-containing protein [Algoriphagus vanfongensis]